jgi:hypothetical protein
MYVCHYFYSPLCTLRNQLLSLPCSWCVVFLLLLSRFSPCFWPSVFLLQCVVCGSLCLPSVELLNV